MVNREIPVVKCIKTFNLGKEKRLDFKKRLLDTAKLYSPTEELTLDQISKLDIWVNSLDIKNDVDFIEGEYYLISNEIYDNPYGKEVLEGIIIEGVEFTVRGNGDGWAWASQNFDEIGLAEYRDYQIKQLLKD